MKSLYQFTTADISIERASKLDKNENCFVYLAAHNKEYFCGNISALHLLKTLYHGGLFILVVISAVFNSVSTINNSHIVILHGFSVCRKNDFSKWVNVPL